MKRISEAHWIWSAENPNAYNPILLARRKFALPAGLGEYKAELAITADSWYRVFINGEWVNDGPCRSWPEHYQYDVLDVTPSLRAGENEVCVLVRYWGTGTFHNLPQQAGLLAQLNVQDGEGETFTLCSDASWEVADLPAWTENTPKVSIQMEAQEMVDARRGDPAVFVDGKISAADGLIFQKAAQICAADAGAWKDLQPRDVALLNRKEVRTQKSPVVTLVERIPAGTVSVTIPAARLAHPGLVEANRNMSMPGGVAAVLELAQSAQTLVETDGMQVYIDGKPAPHGGSSLEVGQHLVTAFVAEAQGHNKEKSFRLYGLPDAAHLSNLLKPGADNPWCYLAFPEYAFARDDLHWQDISPEPRLAGLLEEYAAEVARLAPALNSPAAFLEQAAGRAQALPAEEMLLVDTHWRFLNRKALGPGQAEQASSGLRLLPDSRGDVEVCFDFGEQRLGYLDFELEAEAGVELDLYAVEYMAADGAIQHTWGNRNGLTYITRQGSNRFLSTKRRSGRYVFITLHNQHAPVTLRSLRIFESTYPFEPVAQFACADERLERIWEICSRTLKLCMEDTFTDCPLYEQTHWVGDARNEALYAFTTLGATDIARRCIRLTGQSLERFPIVGSQTPSGWEMLLPAWSFLWGIAVWDYYFYSGDKRFLREAWPWVTQNLKGAEARCTDQGLFSGTFWNMFDWSGSDDRHDTVVHNSMLLAGAIRAAQKCAEELEDGQAASWLGNFGTRLSEALNQLWDADRQTYPDSLLEDGSPSPVASQHTSFLALLYEIATPEIAPHARENVLRPPEWMVRVGSPFAMQYYYETLEKIGHAELILDSIYAAYLPMLKLGSTTVWETFPDGNYNPGGFPTRSHCHAWSAAPLYFLPRVLLGIRQTAPGGSEIEVSPHPLGGITWAEGSVATAQGVLSVRWQVEEGYLKVHIKAPPGVKVKFMENETVRGLGLKPRVNILGG
jgi:alpha-L-rhamnosidase